MKRYVLLAVMVLTMSGVHAELYRAIDKNGKVQYTDQPTQDLDYDELKESKEPGADESMSYETRRAKENFPVTLYSFDKCGELCDQARAFLNKRGIPFTEKSLVTQDEIDNFYKNSGGSDLPTMSVGKTWVKGFLESQWNSELDIAGYPQTPLTYRAPKSAAPPAPKAE